MNPSRSRKIGIILSLGALLSLCSMSIWGYQISTKDDLSGWRERVESQHVMIDSKLSAQDEHLRDIDRQLATLNNDHVIERIAKIESTQDVNQKLLLGISLAIFALVIETFLKYIKLKG